MGARRVPGRGDVDGTSILKLGAEVGSDLDRREIAGKSNSNPSWPPILGLASYFPPNRAKVMLKLPRTAYIPPTRPRNCFLPSPLVSAMPPYTSSPSVNRGLKSCNKEMPPVYTWPRLV